VHLRRALLLFAIVLGLGALAASVSRPRGERSPASPAPAAPQRTPKADEAASDPGIVRIRFRSGGKAVIRRIVAGRAATVVVEVERPGLVELEGLGLSDSAEPDTPATFDVLTHASGRFPVRFIPAARGRPSTLGALSVVRRE
jgi:hypothetical protein